MPDTVIRPCLVCGAEVLMAADTGEPALCILDYFTDDPTEDWERD